MRTSGAASIVAILALAIPAIPNTASAASLSKGTVEISPSLNFSHNSFSFDGSDAGSITILGVNGLVGYCVSDLVEIGGALIADHAALDPGTGGSASVTSVGLAAGVHLNFAAAGNIIPFVRGAVGFASNSGDLSGGDETTVLAPILEAGIRLMVGTSASVNFGVGYRHSVNAEGVKDLSANAFALNVGVSVFPVLGP